MSLNKPLSLHGKRLQTPTPLSGKHYSKYCTKSYGSNIDETLFGSPARFDQQGETMRMVEDWDPPWETNQKKKGAPLLWAPFEYKEFSGLLASDNDNMKKTPRLKSRTPRSANKYRLRNHMPTFVDETLFGPRIQEPSFKAPWNNNNNNQHLTWSPDLQNYTPREGEPFVRPGSRLGEYDDPFIPPTPRDPVVPRVNTPVIKVRSRSAIQTDLKTKIPAGNGKGFDRVKLKLNFNPELADNKDLIERALRLAKASRKTAINSENNKIPTHINAWRRPQSAESTPHTTLKPRSTNISDFLQVNLSTTGTSVPLSARKRPSSARSNATKGRTSGINTPTTDRPSWRP